MKPKSLDYIAICSKHTSPGIYKKVQGFVFGAKKNKLNANAKIIEPSGLNGYVQYINAILFSKSDYIVIRYLPKLGFSIFLMGIILKIKKQSLIIDVPTPMINHIQEIKNHNHEMISKLINIALIYIQGSLPFLSATKIVQYAEESTFFSFGVKKKTLLMGNGVDVDSIQLKKFIQKWPDKTLSMIAVGTVAIWHGWDKVIYTIKDLKEEGFDDFEIQFTIVGEGPELETLKKLVEKYKLENNVIFKGFLTGQDLYNEYEKAHIGIGSFGWDRIGVNIASPIKTREYLACGMPCIYKTKDFDFSYDNKYAIFMRDDMALKDFIKNLANKKLPSTKECRDFAKNSLDFSTKVKKIMENL